MQKIRILIYLLCSIVSAQVFAEEASFKQWQGNAEWPKTDFSKYNVSPDEILSGGPPKDGIPAIDSPKFESPAFAKKWLNDLEPVIAVSHNGHSRAYPLQILIFHEIVNDKLGDEYIAVTFCPLCNASIVFDRKVANQVLDFGTTGRLRNSDLIMYDRQTESWWQQFTGKGIIGEFTNTQLSELPAQIIAFKTFRQHYPNSKVLSRNTGYDRPYGKNPYRGYDDINNTPFLLKGPVDKRLPPMERVISVSVENKSRLYPFGQLKNTAVLNDEFNKVPLVIFATDTVYSALDQSHISASKLIPSYTVFSRELDGVTLKFVLKNNKIFDKQTQSQWSALGAAIKGTLKGKMLKPLIYGQHFAFAWLAFKPDAEIYMR